MKQEKENIILLAYKHLRNELSVEEDLQLNQWLKESSDNQRLFEEIIDDFTTMDDLTFFHNVDTNGMLQKIGKHIGQQAPPRFVAKSKPLYKYMAIAGMAAVIAGIAIGVYLYHQPTQKVLPGSTTVAEQTNQQQTDPFIAKATLTLADGSTLSLPNEPNGFLKQQGNLTISKHDKDIIYNWDSTHAPKKNTNENNNNLVLNNSYNTIAIPMGERYRVILPDGTRIWLNAASAIKFPVTTTGNEIRTANMIGEAYFEVTHSNNNPFLLTVLAGDNKTKRADIQVLGTHFNVNAYDDEKPNKISLKEGNITLSVLPTGGQASLKPGQEAQLTDNGVINVVNNADIESTIAWINGNLYFNKTPLNTTLRKLGKWYGIKVSMNTTAMPDLPFSGTITPETTFKNVKDILEFEYSKLHLDYSEQQKTLSVTYR